MGKHAICAQGVWNQCITRPSSSFAIAHWDAPLRCAPLMAGVRFQKMTSQAFQAFEHAIQDAVDLLNHFDALNTNPPPPEIEVLKRASLVMALAALETYFEDRLIEAVEKIANGPNGEPHLAQFFRDSLAHDLKVFHTPSTDRVRPIFKKYLSLDITEVASPEFSRQLTASQNTVAHRQSATVRRCFHAADSGCRKTRCS